MSTAAGASSDRQRTRWWILLLLFTSRIGLGFQFQTLGSTSDALVAQFSFSNAQVGTLIGLFMAPGLLLSLPAGFAGRYWSDRALVGAGLLCLALGGLLAAQAGGFAGLAAGRLVAGAGFVFSTVYLTKMIADWFAGKELATAMAILVMSWPLGIAMGQVGHLHAAQQFGWRAPFLIAAAWCALGALAVFTGYRPPATTGRAPPRPALGLPRRELWLTLLAAAAWGLFNAGYVLYLSFAPKLLVQGGYSAASAAAVLSSASWVMIVSGTLCGQLADRTGRRNLILFSCMLVGAASLLLLRVPEGALAWCLLFGLVGASPAGLIVAMTGASMAPQRRAFGMGVYFTFYFALQSLGPPLGGLLYDRTGDPFAAIALAASMFLAVIAVGWLFARLAGRGAG